MLSYIHNIVYKNNFLKLSSNDPDHPSLYVLLFLSHRFIPLDRKIYDYPIHLLF